MSISSVTSEALQQKLRQLLPSQQGFGTDLSASDTIIPVIDLTAAAEGSDVGQNLQTAFSFASVNPFDAIGGSTVVANNVGFWRIYAVADISDTGSTVELKFQLTDGVTTKDLLFIRRNATGSNSYVLEFVVFLNAGESLSATSNNVSGALTGSAQQIADANGNLVNPAGFNPQ
jgi:hypothetical protein